MGKHKVCPIQRNNFFGAQMFIQSKAAPSFIMIDRICDIQSDTIKGVKTFSQAHAYLGIEACAQLGAFHARFDIGFCRHVFLINVKGYHFCPTDKLHGAFIITGICLSRSSDAFLYAIQIKNDTSTYNKGNFLFGVADYDERFDRSRLKRHYQNIFYDVCDSEPKCPKSKGRVSQSERLSCNA